MRRAAIIAGILGGCGLLIWALRSDSGPLKLAALTVVLLGAAGLLIASPAAREHVAEEMPLGTGDLVRRLFALRPRPILLTVAAAIVLLWAAGALKQATYPRGTVEPYAFSRQDQLERLSPIAAVAELQEEFPAEDQRYSPWGVFLRYERNIVAVVPKGWQSRVDVYPDDVAWQRFGRILSPSWGRAYLAEPRIPDSARAVPARADLERAARELRAAWRAQGVCYGWNVEIRSGRGKGRLVGSSDGVGRPLDRRGCPRWLELQGWIDPRAGAYRSRGEPGDWSFQYEWLLDASVPSTSIEALDIGFGEVITGHTTEPNADGLRPGKGLLETIGALPLLAAEAERLPPVPMPPPGVPGGEQLSPVVRSDGERRAEEGGEAFVPALLQVAGGALVLVLVLTVPPGIVARVIRLLRRPARNRG